MTHANGVCGSQMPTELEDFAADLERLSREHTNWFMLAKALRDAGYRKTVKPRSRYMDAEAIAKAAAMLDDHFSYGEVARTVGFSHQAIRSRFPNRGWNSRSG